MTPTPATTTTTRRTITPTRSIARLVAAVALIVAFVGAGGATPAAAEWIGPCEFRLDQPHVSGELLALYDYPVLRSHGRYYCTSRDLLYVNGEITLRRCVTDMQDAMTCAAIAEGAESHTFANNTINYTPGHWKILGTADSEPYPETGWYVATALFEICVFNGGVYPGSMQSNWVHWNQEKGKVDSVTKYVGPIIVPPAPAPAP